MTAIPTASPSSTRTTAVAVVIVAFVAGLFAGIAGDRFYFHRAFPGRRDFAPHRIVDRLDRELHFTAQQRTQVQQIIDTHHTRIDALMSAIRPQVRKEIETSNAEIDKILTPDQRATFAKIRLRMQGRRGMPPPPPAH